MEEMLLFFIGILIWQLLTFVIAQVDQEQALAFAMCFIFIPLQILIFPFRIVYKYFKKRKVKTKK